MGTFCVDIEVAGLGRRPLWTALNRVMVESGSEMTWLPVEIAHKLKLAVFKKDEPFLTADGRQITRDVGIALIRCGEFKTVDEVVFAKPGDLR